MHGTDDMTLSSHYTSLNLKHYGAITARDLENLPRSLEKLWIGPYFATNLSLRSIIEKLPMTYLTHLDLDLSKLHTSCEQQDDTVAAVLQHATKLVHFGLRMHPQEKGGGDSLSMSIAKSLHSAANMASLDLHKNRIGDAGVQTLVSAISSNGCAITQLDLSYNHLTSVGCKALAQLLVSKDCRLEILDLSCNSGIDQDGFLALVEAFKSNTSLRRISLALCPQLRRQNCSAATANPYCCVHQQLLQCLELYNSNLQWICLPQTQLLECSRDCGNAQTMIGYYLALNRVGRRFLITKETEDHVVIPTSLWPRIIARAARLEARHKGSCNDSMFYFLQNTVPIWAAGEH